jgi:hypothetical protein
VRTSQRRPLITGAALVFGLVKPMLATELLEVHEYAMKHPKSMNSAVLHVASVSYGFAARFATG